MRHTRLTKPLGMEEGFESLGYLIRILREHNIGEYIWGAGDICVTEILNIELPNGKIMEIRAGDYDESAEINIIDKSQKQS